MAPKQYYNNITFNEEKYNKIVIIISLFLISLLLFLQFQNEPQITKEKSNLPLACDTFNMKKFLETGGSKMLVTKEDWIVENERMRYICGG